MMSVFGLLDRDMDYIQKAMSQFKEIDKAVVFGSRALGNYKKGSDVDISISGPAITTKTICSLDDFLNEVYPLPYFFDLIHYEEITNEDLRRHIDQFGKELYTKSGE